MKERRVDLHRPAEPRSVGAPVGAHVVEGGDRFSEDALDAAERHVAPCGDVGLGGAPSPLWWILRRVMTSNTFAVSK